ncbi:hypothetical protein Tsubulata_014903 [Turnera subulata]|uniref:Cyclin-dependent protein kinase inhibitor SMR3 n=1 Tax=Turnera subulata TaxID=218843 RepID=A0A9Q0G3V7_9ROSI|nr:hypothetical protein Tsubulata_014903 [Turnera subulata]
MCSDFDDRVVSLLSMASNSDVFLVKEHKEEIEFFLLKRTSSLEYQETRHVRVLQDPDDAATLQKHEHEQGPYKDGYNEEKPGCSNSSELKSDMESSLGELKEESGIAGVVNEDDDGFKTPTSLDHKLPVITECPPAPRKPHLSMKRKPPSPRARRSLQFLDLSQDVESLFPRPILRDFYQKMKKARRESSMETTLS